MRERDERDERCVRPVLWALARVCVRVLWSLACPLVDIFGVHILEEKTLAKKEFSVAISRRALKFLAQRGRRVTNTSEIQKKARQEQQQHKGIALLSL